MRLLRQCIVVMIAVLCAALAIMTLIARLMATQADLLLPTLEAELSSRLQAQVRVDSLAMSLQGRYLKVELNGLDIRAPGQDISPLPTDSAPPSSTATDEGGALVSASSARSRPPGLFSLARMVVRLDLVQSLKQSSPVLASAAISGSEMHLYQQDGLAWGWPAPARLPLDSGAGMPLALASLDTFLVELVRQRLKVSDAALTLHGKDDKVSLHTPSLVVTGDDGGSWIEGDLYIKAAQSGRTQGFHNAMRLRAKLRGGDQAARDLSAALQLDMRLEHLAAMTALVLPESLSAHVPDNANATLWARWQDATLEEARLALDVPTLSLQRVGQAVVLSEITAGALWQREGEGGQAWLQGDAESVDWGSSERAGAGPALPRDWQLRHQPGEWQLGTSEFDLASLAAWRHYMGLPESLARVLDRLAPHGQIQALQMGQQAGDWAVSASVADLKLAPWMEAPGGGPFDAWVEARNRRGKVAFKGKGGTEFTLPKVFQAPLVLDHASGEIEWVYEGPRSLISARNLVFGWQGATLNGRFGLLNDPAGGRLGIELEGEQLDARARPLNAWLPDRLLDPALSAWLSRGVSGIAESAHLTLGFPLKKASGLPPEARLKLDVADARIPSMPGWPDVEDMMAGLVWENGKGVKVDLESARLGQIDLSSARAHLHQGRLSLNAQLGAGAPEFLNTMTDLSLELPDWVVTLQAEGRLDADLALDLRLKGPVIDDASLDVIPRLEQLTPFPGAEPLRNIRGKLNWKRQAGDNAANDDVSGQLDGSWFGRPWRARLTPDQAVVFNGGAPLEAIRAWQALPEWLSGELEWQGRFQWQPVPRLTLGGDGLGLEVDLPAPFAKRADSAWPWQLDVDLAKGRLEGHIDDLAQWRRDLQGGADTLRLGAGALAQPDWPLEPGLDVSIALPSLDLPAWQKALSGAAEPSPAPALQGLERPFRLQLSTPCLARKQRCLGLVRLDAQHADGNLQATLGGDLVAGHLVYRQGRPADTRLTVERAELTPLLTAIKPLPDPSVPPWWQQVETLKPAIKALPAGLETLGSGQFNLDQVSLDGQTFGPLEGRWRTDAHGMTLAPLKARIGDLKLAGEWHWKGSPHSSYSHLMLDADGDNLGTALTALGHPEYLASQSAHLQGQVFWPGAPWQFDLVHAKGDLEVDLRNGRFTTLDSAPAKMIGLFNVKRIFKRLQLDFSDVTGQGLAFDHLHGAAQLESGQIRIKTPLLVDAPFASMALGGKVDLLRRELEQELSVVLPITQALPLAGLAAGGPAMGGVMLLVNALFGDRLEASTALNFTISGPWASPRIDQQGGQ